MGLSDTPPQLDADSISRSSRDPLLDPGLVDVVARREDARTRRLPPERGGHVLREVADDRPVFLESELVGIVRRRVSASARARSWLSCLMSVEGSAASVRDQVQGGSLLGEVERVLVAHV